MTTDPSLDDAYALQDANGVKDLYGTWANTYDTGFARDQGYQLPQVVAQAFVENGGKGPVLDVGAGTGLGAVALSKLGVTPIDGVDLSPEMLAVARAKNLYRTLIEADITQPLPNTPRYAGIISAGTFTLGHVGPDGLEMLLNGAAANTLFTISVNAKHFETAGFATFLERAAGKITNLTFKDLKIYDDRADDAHQNDTARLLIFRAI